MVQLSFKTHRGQQVLLAACAVSRPAPAAHLSRHGGRDRVVGFADIAALPDPEWDVPVPGRYTVGGLVPGGRVASVPLVAETEPLADWERDLLALPVGETPAPTQRALAEESMVQDLEDAWVETEQDADPLPIETLLADAKTVMRNRGIAFNDDLAADRVLSDARCTLIAAAAWVDDASGAALTEDCDAVLDAVAARPKLRHDTSLLMALAPVVAMLKDLVA